MNIVRNYLILILIALNAAAIAVRKFGVDEDWAIVIAATCVVMATPIANKYK